MLNLVLIGPPGAGKGTQSQHIVKRYGLLHLAPGDMLRWQIQHKTALGKQVETQVNQGKLVPDQLITELIADAMAKHKYPYGLLFDGMPRTVKQAELLDDYLATKDLDIDLVLALETSKATVQQRIRERSRVLKRADDQDSVRVSMRLRVYNQQTAPVLSYYARQGKLVSISGEGTVEAVSLRIRDAIESYRKL